MKNVFKTAVVAAAAAAFVASVAVAGDQQRGGDQRRGPGFGQGRPGGPGGPGGRGGPIGVLGDLTDAQREQVKTIMAEQREGTQGPGLEMKLRQALEQELFADTPNDQKIEELKQQLVAASAEQLTRHIAVQRRINPILTAEQRAKARERIGQRGENRPRGDRGGRGLRF